MHLATGMGGMPHPPFMIPNNMRPPNPNMRPPNMAPLSMPPQPQFPHRRPFERPSDNDESQNKKSKIEGQFMPEHQFLSAHPVCEIFSFAFNFVFMCI